VSQFILQLQFPSELHSIAGTPKDIWIELNIKLSGKYSLTVRYVNLSAGSLSATVLLFNKAASRLPEATFLRFKPSTHGQWKAKKLGVPVNLYEVVTGKLIQF
jgi:hypothetical protein